MNRFAVVALLLLALSGCGGSSNSPGVGPPTPPPPAPPPPPPPTLPSLSAAEVERILAQAAHEAQARGARATLAVVDRAGNVLAVYRMAGAAPTFRISSGRGASGGLENVAVLPSELAAIAKALTGAYLSSSGQAFSTRTASQIVQEHFNPGERGQPAGPLFGVQFSQLPCSDLSQREGDGQRGPKRSPLGLSADPGGLPLYQDGQVVGGLGVMADGVYGLDLDIADNDEDLDERIAVAGSFGFAAPVDRRAERVSLDGRTLRYVDGETLRSTPATAPPLAGIAGSLVAVPGYAAAIVRDGVALGTAASGLRADSGVFADLGGQILVDGTDSNRHAPRAGTDGGLTAAEVGTLLRQALGVANRARAQIRLPAGSVAQVSIAVVDSRGEILGLVRGADAPVFGIDVAVQKARSANFFSDPAAAAAIMALAPANYLAPPATSAPGAYVANLRSFLNDPSALGNGIAWSARAIGNVARPLFPDGVDAGVTGPLSKPLAAWSPFSTGLQLDLAHDRLVAAIGGDPAIGCTGLTALRNGLQIFPGGVPIYRGNLRLGAIGVSGDGVDQDDMVAFLGLALAGNALGGAIGNAPPGIRADILVPAGTGTRLRYVQCPQAPFVDSSEQNVCEGR